MLHLGAYLVAGLMTAVAVWRFPAVVYGDAHRRALWGCYAGFAAALWIKTPASRDWLNKALITDVSVLFEHLVSIGAILASLTFVVASYGRVGSAETVRRHVTVSRWVDRGAYQASVGVLLAMTALFFTVVDREDPSADFIAQHAGQWGATLYVSVFCIYSATASAVCGYQWTSGTRRAESRSLRVGLTLMSVAMGMSVLYCLIRTIFMWTALVVPFSRNFAHQLGAGMEAMQMVLFTLFAAGAIVPATRALGVRWKAGRSLWCLYPLWRDLMVAVPGLGFARPAPRLREVTRLSPPSFVRLDRWIQDIADAVDQLRHYAPPMLLDCVEAETADHEDPPAAAEAYWIRAVLQSHAQGQRSEYPSDSLPTKLISETAAEAAWLERVQAVYSTLTYQGGQRVLEAALHAPEPDWAL